MKLVGYIEPVYLNSFTIPVYKDDEDEFYYHQLDNNFRITSFEQTAIPPQYFKPTMLDVEFKEGDYGAIAFISEATEFIGPVSLTIEKIDAFVSSLRENLASVKKEIEFVAQSINLELEPQSLHHSKRTIVLIDVIFKKQNPNFIPQFLFQNFIVGSSNNSAWEFGKEISKGTYYKENNPFVIYGKRGVGKTHLVQAIANEVRSKKSNKSAIYLSFGQLGMILNNLNTAKNHDLFFKHLDEPELVVIDDLQNIPNTSRIQKSVEKFFSYLLDSQKQVIITTRESPAHLNWLLGETEKKASWGTVVGITPPDFAMRKSFITRRLRLAGIESNYQVLEYLTISSDGSIRDLNNLLNALIQNYSKINRKGKLEIDLKSVNPVLNIFEYRPKNEELNIELITRIVSAYFNIGSEEMSRDSMSDSAKIARQIIMYVADLYLTNSYQELATQFKEKNHLAIAEEVQSAVTRSDTSTRFKMILLDIVNRIYDQLQKNI